MRLIPACGLALAFAMSCGLEAVAQQQKAQKAAPKAAQAPKPDAQKPAATEPPPLVYSSWTKLCAKPPEAGGKTVCRTGKDGRLETGVPMVGAILSEVEGEPRKILQVMLPLGILLPRGTRVLIDSDEQGAMILPIIVCAGGGCMAQAEASAELIAKLKKGQNLYVQAYNMQQSVFTLALPLTDFAKAYDGPPTDPKAVEERNKKLQEELEKRARERLQQQPK
jgi:invasion protein IalB